MIDLDKLEALAKSATPGPWFYQDESDAYTHIVRPVDNPGRIIASGTQTSDARGETTGRFIAAANPATVLEMITLIRELAVVSIPVIKEGAKIEGGEPINAQKIRDALRKAYNTGQSYFQLADSEYTSHHRKADALAAKFAEFIEEQVVLLSAAAPVADTAQQWISVEDRLPDHYCIAAYLTPRGKYRVIRAVYYKQFEIEANGEECDSEHNEADDQEYIKAGWYELIDNWGDYSSCFVNEGEVKFWQPLPAAPAPGANHDQG